MEDWGLDRSENIIGGRVSEWWKKMWRKWVKKRNKGFKDKAFWVLKSWLVRAIISPLIIISCKLWYQAANVINKTMVYMFFMVLYKIKQTHSFVVFLKLFKHFPKLCFFLFVTFLMFWSCSLFVSPAFIFSSSNFQFF